jgi:glutathione peroxidase-family protein
MDKALTNGPDAAEVFKYAKRAFPGDITWNFDGGFAFGADGRPIGKFSLRGDLAYADRLVRQAVATTAAGAR